MVLKKRFFKVVNLFYHCPSFEQTWIPFNKGKYVPNLVEIGPVVLEKIFKSYQFFYHFPILSPLGRACMALHLKKKILFTKGYFVPSLVEIGQVDLEKKMKLWKDYRRTDRQTTDDRWSEKLIWSFSSGELKTTKKRTWQQKGKKSALRRFKYALYCFRIAFLSGK